MKRFRKKILTIFVFIFILSIIFFFFFRFKGKEKTNSGDLKIGIVTEKGLGIVSISEERKIINILKIGEEMQIWIPGGLGWYRNDRIRKILDQEKRRQKALDIFFYNLGFIPDEVFFLNEMNDWKKLSNLGLKKWLKFKIYERNFIMNEEQLKGDYIDTQDLFLNNTMARDFADTKIINDETRLTIINATSESGLANFIANRLSWSGFSVISLDNTTEKIDKCLIKSGSKLKENYVFNVLDNLWKCEQKEDLDLSEFETELYLGEKFLQMLKYSSYVRTF